MIKVFIISVISIITGLAAYLFYKIYTIIQKKEIIELNTSTLQLFSFVTINNQILGNASLSNMNGKIIFNFFSPNCEHCQYMATQYLQHKEQLKDITILMVTIADSTTTVHFYNDYKLNELPNIIVLRDPKFQFYKIFGTARVPSFFIYNHQKLVKKIIGETKIENLLIE